MSPRRDWISDPPPAAPQRPGRRRSARQERQRRTEHHRHDTNPRRLPIAAGALVVLVAVGFGFRAWLDRTPGDPVVPPSPAAPVSAPAAGTPSPGVGAGAPAPGATSAAPLDTQAPPEPDSDLPDSGTDPNTAARISAAAVAFVTAYARPAADVPETTWWAGVEPTLTPDAAASVRGTDPTRVPWSRVTGAPQLVPAPEFAADYLVRDVDVPTDTGSLRVTVDLDQLRVQKWRTTP